MRGAGSLWIIAFLSIALQGCVGGTGGILGGGDEIEVPEWDTTFYYKKGTNFQQEAKVMELQNAGKTAEA
ncbi:MAG: hypothetical protein VXZ65_03425, partial [Candidatus Thermoplasmatota archaeon]|nr:hypothetical protein [Candidatus Thermoplasmatota archaeon]